MRRRALVAFVAVAALAALLVTSATAGGFPRPHEVQLTLNNVETLDGAFYELWVIKGKKKRSAGSFNVDGSGKLVDGFGHPAKFYSPIDPAKADSLVVTIEPLPDPKRGPSGIAILTTKKVGKNQSRLIFPVPFKQISGSFILATPTDNDGGNETAGVWFLDPAAGPGPGLNLPTLPGGWLWEGWGVNQGTPLTTGTFSSASGADNAAPFSGPNPGPPFPGEDFVANLPAGLGPVNLADGSSAIVLSIEPNLNGVDPTGPAPFSIKPAVTMVPAGSADHASITLERNAGTKPSGSARY